MDLCVCCVLTSLLGGSLNHLGVLLDTSNEPLPPLARHRKLRLRGTGSTSRRAAVGGGNSNARILGHILSRNDTVETVDLRCVALLSI